MTSVLRYLTGFFSADTHQPGLIQKLDGTVWLVNPDGSEVQITGAGSGVTDFPITFTHADSPLTSLPIVAVDLDAQTLQLSGDHTAIFDDILSVYAAPGGEIVVSGSTGNDGVHYFSEATYDSGSNRTTVAITSDIPLTDPTADGDVTPSVVYKASVTVPPNGAVEWVLIETTEAWSDGDGFYLIAGDQDDAQAFAAVSDGVGVDATGIDDATNTLWQWPQNTLHQADSSPTPNVLNGNLAGYKRYPSGGTLSVLAVENPGTTQGETTLTFHVHDGATPEPATRIPPGTP